MSSLLPTGTVTFMFTDIEGSTQLAQRFGSEYSDLVGDHFEILRAALDGEGGVEVKTTGDGLFAVFASATAALRVACEVQDAISNFAWPERGDIRVRIGLHSGEATVSENDYVGVEVHRAARIMAAGHGGQTLLSESTRHLGGDQFEYASLGRHLLRGLEIDETIYQLLVPKLPSNFPPLNTAKAAPNNLPVRVSSIVGREADIEAVGDLLSEHRLVTVLGPGGVGKTSLAVTVGSSVTSRFRGGVTFVDLSTVTEPAFVISSIADQIGVDEKTVRGIAEHVGSSPMLLILDNLEQLLGAVSDIGELLTATEDLRLLVTSQAPLFVTGEHRYTLSPLEGDATPDSPGVQLFIERARAADPSLSPDLAEIAALVQLLDGLPLAIELTAAMASLMTPAEMIERLSAGETMARSVDGSPNRHASLEGALSWSYGLLDVSTQMAFRRLSVFTGDMNLDAAEEVIGDDLEDPVGCVADLVDRSFLLRRTGPSRRMYMLDGVRRFGRSLLDESGESDLIRSRLADQFCGMAAQAYSGLQSDKGEWWRTRIEDELPNIRETLSILQSAGERERGLELLGNTWRFYQSRGHLIELGIWLDRFFELPPTKSESVGLAKGLMGRAAASYWRGETDAAADDYEQAVGIARELGDASLTADALYGLGTSLIIAERSDEAMPRIEEAREIYQRLGDMGGIADIVTSEAFVVIRSHGLVGLDPVFERAVDLYSQAGRLIHATQAMFARSAVAIAEGRFEDAKQHAETGIRGGLRLSDVFLQTWGLGYMALFEVESERFELAGLYAGAAERSNEQIGGGWGPQTVGLPTAQETLSERLGPDTTRELVSAGRELTLAEAVELALGPDRSIAAEALEAH